MTYRSVLVSIIGMALPVLAGVWLMPKNEARSAVNLAGRDPNQWLLLWLSRSREWLNNAVRHGHLPGNGTPSTTVRHG